MAPGDTGILYQKLAVGISTLVISLTFGLLPYHLSRTKDIISDHDKESKICCSSNGNNFVATTTIQDPTMPPKWLSWATSFGGGVFLGAAMLHLLPEASEVLDDNFPFANLLCSVGFLMVLALEEMMPHHNTESSSTLALVSALSFHSLFDGLAIGSTTSNGQLKAVSIAILAHKPISAFALGSILICKQLALSQPTKSIEIGKNMAFELNQSMASQDITDTTQKEMLPNHDKRPKIRRLSSSGRSMAYYYYKYAHDECDDVSCSKKECVCTNLLQLNENEPPAATPDGTYGTYQQAQIPCTQSKTQDTPTTTMIVCIVFFSTTSLLGTIVGAWGLQYIGNSQFTQTFNTSPSIPLAEIVAAACQSLAAGSFLYASTMEALATERGDHHRHHFHHDDDATTKENESHHSIVRTNRVGAALIGVVLMAFVRMLEK
jgi:zinc transporter ZupT